MTSFDHLTTRRSHAQHYDLGRSQLRGPSSSGKLSLPIPDLRFEQSYLQSLQGFIHRDDAQACSKIKSDDNMASGIRNGERLTRDKSIDTAGKASGTEGGLYGAPLRMDWGGIVYVTIRNQVRISNYDISRGD